MKAMFLTVLGALALSAPAAAQGVTISVGVDAFVPVAGTTVVFTSQAVPEAVVVDNGVNGTVILEQRTRFGRMNTVRMNLRYPNHHRVAGRIVNDWVWVSGRRVLASKVFHHYYAPRARYAAYRHAHTYVAGYRVHGGHHGHAARRDYDRHRHHDRADRRDRRDHRDSCHEPGHPGRGHAYGKCKNKDRGRDYANNGRGHGKHHDKANNGRGHGKRDDKANNGRGHGKGKGKDKAKSNKGNRGHGKDKAKGNSGRRGNGNGKGRGRA
jgi:hypothetical protein